MPRNVKEIPSFVYDPSCVLYVPLWKRDGTTFISDDATGHPCTVTGATHGIQGRTFNGTSHSISIPDAASLDIVNAITIGGWVKVGLLSTLQSIFSKGNQSVAFSYGIDILATDYFEFNFYSGDWRKVTDATTPVSLNRWYHVMATYDRENGKIYINGGLKQTTAFTQAMVVTTYDFLIGRDSAPEPPDWFNGSIGEVSVYNRAWSAAEVMNNYLATKWRFA